MVNSQIPEDPKRVNIFLATRSKVLNGGARSKRLQLLGTEGWHRLVPRVSLSVDMNCAPNIFHKTRKVFIE